jgi:hypothetical protein
MLTGNRKFVNSGGMRYPSRLLVGVVLFLGATVEASEHSSSRVPGQSRGQRRFNYEARFGRRVGPPISKTVTVPRKRVPHQETFEITTFRRLGVATHAYDVWAPTRQQNLEDVGEWVRVHAALTDADENLMRNEKAIRIIDDPLYPVSVQEVFGHVPNIHEAMPDIYHGWVTRAVRSAIYRNGGCGRCGPMDVYITDTKISGPVLSVSYIFAKGLSATWMGGYTEFNVARMFTKQPSWGSFDAPPELYTRFTGPIADVGEQEHRIDKVEYLFALGKLRFKPE